MVKNFTHNVIRLRKGKPSVSQVYWLIVILNKKKASSQKQVEQLGFFKQGKEKLFSVNYQRLSYYLNKGYKLKNSIKKYIYWHSIVFNKYYKLNKIKKLQNLYKLFFKKKLKKISLKKKKFKGFPALPFYQNYQTKANELIIKWDKWWDKKEALKKEMKEKKKAEARAKEIAEAKARAKAWRIMNYKKQKKDKNYIIQPLEVKPLDYNAEYEKMMLENKLEKKAEREAPLKKRKAQVKYLKKAIKIKDVFKF